jgi:predicted transcriptional regulator
MNQNDAVIASTGELERMTAEVVSAYVMKNKLTPGEMPGLIHSVFMSFREASTAGTSIATKAGKPAVSIRKSVTPDDRICLEDGHKCKMLKRHLRVVHGLAPEEYRRKWKLRPGYPMVAPTYAKQRSKLAKEIGLGRKRGAKATGSRRTK